MNSNRVTKERIDHLINSADVVVRTEYGKCTTVVMRLENGFILTESSACVDPANYDMNLGKKLCYEHIENRLWELEGYALQKCLYERKHPKDAVTENEGTFGWALHFLKEGYKARRRGWNGKNQYIQLAIGISYMTTSGEIVNCEHEAIGNKAIAFVGTSGVQMGWLASQADMLAEDWEVCVE